MTQEDRVEPVAGTGITPGTSTSDNQNTSTTGATSAQRHERKDMPKFIYVILFLAVFALLGTSWYLYRNGVAQAKDIGSHEQQVEVLETDNKALKAKVERQRLAAITAEKLLRQHQQRLAVARQSGCEDLARKLPSCINKLRKGTVDDYMEAIKQE